MIRPAAPHLPLFGMAGSIVFASLWRGLDASQSRMSRHMKVLREAGLVTDRRDAQWVRFRLNPKLAAERRAVVAAVLAAERISERDVA
jgi:ArsR family transcriptional regulator